MTIADADRRRAMAAGLAAIALWGALAALSVSAGPIPPFQMVAMTFAVGASIGIVRALARGVGWRGLLGWPMRVWLLGVGGLFGYHALYFAALQLAPPAEANLVNYLWPLLIVLLVRAARRRAPGLAASARRLSRLCRRRPAGLRPRLELHRRTRPGLRAGAGLRRRLVALLGAVAPLRRDADRRHRRLLRGVGPAVARLPSPVRAHGVARHDDGVARRAGDRPRPRGRPRSISGTTPSSAATSARWARSPMPRRSCRRRC